MDTALDELEKSFHAWRSAKKSARDRVPESLLCQARELGGSFSEIEISRRCRLARARLFPDGKTGAAGFVELPGFSVPTAITVDIRSKRGDRITVTLPACTDLGTLFTALRS